MPERLANLWEEGETAGAPYIVVSTDCAPLSSDSIALSLFANMTIDMEKHQEVSDTVSEKRCK